MNKPGHVHIIIAITLSVIFGIMLGSQLDFSKKFSLFPENPEEVKIRKLLQFIRHEYVEEVNTDSILEIAIDDIMGSLDPHSVYIPKEELERTREQMNGKFKGIGIRFRLYRDTVVIASLIHDGPAEKAGLLPGDRILIVDGDTLYGKLYDSEQIVEKIKKSKNDEIALKIYRKSGDSILDVAFAKEEVNIESVPASLMIDEGLGYIRIIRFAKNTREEFHKALEKLTASGMRALVLDLRGNTGGYMNMAVEVADELLEKGLPIVETRRKNQVTDKVFAQDNGLFENGQVFVLVDENSASASEIVAGALQDNDRATIIGRRTYGKGLVQQEMDLGDGSAIRLTTGKYFTPTGRSIQKPYTKGENDEYFNDHLYRLHNGELFHRDSIPVNEI